MSSKKLGADHKCNCKKARARTKKLTPNETSKDHCKRKRNTFVFNPEEETWAEPYMQPLRKDFSDVSVVCDSKIELPWKDIALQTKGMKIRGEVTLGRKSINSDGVEEIAERDLQEKESNGTMALPWKDLIVSNIVQPHESTLGIDQCDSSLEIPWDFLSLDAPVHINPIPEKESCIPEDVEIPWNDLLIPRNIVIETQKKIKHPSNRYPPRSVANIRRGCLPCSKAKK